MFQKRKQESVAFAICIPCVQWCVFRRGFCNITLQNMINVTPEKRKKLDEDAVVAVLAPFNAFPKVSFDSIKLHSPASRDVILKNPNKSALQIELIRLPDSDRGFQWSFTSCKLPSESEQRLTICWIPSEYGSWRDNVKVLNKKNNKLICEIILLSSTEDPPMVPRRCLRSQSQSKLQKRVKITQQYSENKENYLANSSKDMSKDVSNQNKIPTNKYSFKSEHHSQKSEKQHITGNSSSTITSKDAVQSSTNPDTPRRVTYEVLAPVSATRRSTYCLRNRQLTSITDLEDEKHKFDSIASPGAHNESLERAASKLAEGATCNSQKKIASSSFTIPTLEATQTCTLVRRTTFEKITEESEARLICDQFKVSNLSAESNHQPVARFSLDSLGGSDVFNDSLDDKTNRLVCSKNMIPNLDFDNINFDTFTINSQDDSKPLTLRDDNLREGTDYILPFELKLDEATNKVSQTISYKDQNFNPLNQEILNIDHIIVEKEEPIEFKFTNEIVDIEKTQSCNDKDTKIATFSFTDLNFDIKLSPIKNTSFQSEDEVINFKSDTRLTENITSYLPKFECQTLKQESDNIDDVSIPYSEIKSNYSQINANVKEDISLKTSDITRKSSFQSSSNIPCNFDQKENKTVIIEKSINKETPCNSFVETGDTTLANVKSSTPVHSSSNSGQSNDLGKPEQRALIWDISPPKKSELEKNISQPKNTFAVPKNKKTTAAMKTFLLTHFSDVNILPSKSKLDLKANSCNDQLLITPSNNRNDRETNVPQKSGKVFTVPTNTLKRRSSTLHTTINTSPPKITKIAQDAKVKRLSTPTLNKPITRSLSDTKKKSNMAPLSATRTSYVSSKSRKCIRVTEWLPIRKLQLFSKSSQDSDSTTSVESPTDFSSPDPFLATTTLNPFDEGQLYYSEEWLREQEQDLIAWAHLMLQPPPELQLDRYHTAHSTFYRLNALRIAAYNILVSPQVAGILVKVKSAVEKRIICIRQDKQLHADLGLQETVVTLLMCYNPLWLRLCLEAVYQCTIHLKCHSDSAGLISFIRKRVISDEYLLQAFSHPTIPYLMMPEFEDKMKKFTLYKFLVLVYLLDLVKCKKVILHDPCLFKKDSKFKSSREILVEFNKEFIAGAGDITKVLRARGYEVSYSQTYLHEFDFSLNDTSQLRDGIRITKLAEILVGDNSLCSKLRVPAISSLQKKFNAEIAFNALKKAGYKLPENITPKNICDGHKEKTLSFLWHLRGIVQKRAVYLIITKWREMKLLKNDREHYLNLRNSTIKIQRWYRKSKYQQRNKEEVEKAKKERQSFLSLRSSAIILQRRYRKIREKQINIKKNKAAFTIQNWYRNRMNLKKGRYPFKVKKNAAVQIQRAYRKYIERKQKLISEERKYFIDLIKATIFIQKMFRANMCMKRERQVFIRKRSSAILLQRKYRAYVLARGNRQMFLSMKSATLVIQRRYRAKLLGRSIKQTFLTMKIATVMLQRRYRAILLARKIRDMFLKIKASVVAIQRRYRANILAKNTRQVFLEMKAAVIRVETRYRAIILARHTRQEFLQLKSSAIVVQQRYRAKLLSRKTREEFLKMKLAVVVMQQRYRDNILARNTRQMFLEMKSAAIVIQRRYRTKLFAKCCRQTFLKRKAASVVLQRRYRAKVIARKYREMFLKIKAAAVMVQTRFRANLCARKNKQRFLEMKAAAIILQRRYRALLLVRKQREMFMKFRTAALVVQRKYRAKSLARSSRLMFLKMKAAAIVVQRRYRTKLIARKTREVFLKIKAATILVQRRYRTTRQARNDIQVFLNMRVAAIVMQTRYRAKLLARNNRHMFLKMKAAAIVLQRRYRAKLLARNNRHMFLKMKAAAIVLQRRYRAKLLARNNRHMFLKMKAAAIVLQRRYRAKLLARNNRHMFLKMKAAAILLQRRYRAKLLARNNRHMFLKMKAAAIVLQKRYRAKLIARNDRQLFLEIKEAALVLQYKYRAKLSARKTRKTFLEMKNAALVIQRRYRANLMTRTTREMFLELKAVALVLQRIYRTKLIARKAREIFLKMKAAAIVAQRKYRAKLIARNNRKTFLNMKAATIILQRRYRAKLIGKKTRETFLKMKAAAIVSQRRYRAKLIARNNRKTFLNMKAAAVILQRRYRAKLIGKTTREIYLKMRAAAILLQNRYRIKLLGRNNRQMFLQIKVAAVVVQRRYRSNLLARINRQMFLEIKAAAVVVQRRFRANVLARKVRERFLELKRSALIVQRRFRAKCLVNHDRQLFLRLKAATLTCQRKFRFIRQSKNISQERILQHKIKAAIKIQAAWRGRIVRKRIVVPRPQINPPDMNTFRHPLIKRGRSSLSALRDFSKYSVGELLKALYNLDVLTKLSANQCEHFVSSGVVNILYALLPTANKAIGTDRCIELTLLILSNLYKAPSTADTVWKETLECNGVVQLVELMMNFRLEKTSSVFCKAATLVWLFAQDPEKAKVIMRNPKVKNILCYIIKTMTKASGPTPHTSKNTKSSARKRFPPVKPDWGNYFDLPRTFEEKNFAIDSVKKALNFTN